MQAKRKMSTALIDEGCRVPRKAIAVALAACFSGTAGANPTGGVVVHGAANFSNPAVNVLNINTLTPKTIINWGSFSISAGELTRILQPTALSAVLNRVVGSDPSAILGALQSNGRVYLLNPNGIVFGAGSQINVAGLVASTLNLSDADFLSGRMNFTNGIGAGSVVNQGSINATGGPVYLVGNSVTNNGLITNPNGEVVLAAGNSVELVNPGTPNLRVEIVAPDNEAKNLGTISAEAGRIGIYAGLIRQGGVINADSAVAEGGRIILKSTKRTDLEAGSVTSARGTSGGEILALSDMSSGTTNVAGTLDVSATAGNGGFVDTSAASVRVADSADVTASGSLGGRSGKWLIDPNDFFIAAYGGGISGSALGLALDVGPTGADVEISTLTSSGGVPGFGDIYVNDTVVWTKGTTLTLSAERNILFGLPSAIKLNGGTTGNVILNAGGNIQTNAYGGYVDVRGNALSATAATGIGVIQNTLQTEVATATLTNTTSGDINLRNYRDLSVSATTPSGLINLSSGDTNQLIVNSGGISASGTLNLYASHVEIHGNTVAGGNIGISAGAPASIIVGSGANLHSTGGDLNLGTNHFDFGGGGTVKGNNIYIQNFFGDFDIGVSPRTSNETLTTASIPKLALNAPASGVVEISSGSFGSNSLYVNDAITFTTPNVQNLRLIGGGGVRQDPPGVITVTNLEAQSSNGPVVLNTATNSVAGLAGFAKDQFLFKNAGNLTVNGISVTGAPGVTATAGITVTGGSLTVAGSIVASGASGSSVSGAGSGKVELDASGLVQINSILAAYGGYGGSGGVGGNAEIKVTAGGGINVASGANLLAFGGSGGSSIYAGGNALISLINTSASVPTVIGGSLHAAGGSGFVGGGSGIVSVRSDGGITVNPGASLQAIGGSAGSSFSTKGPAAVELIAYGGNITQNGYLLAFGGPATSIELSALSTGGTILQTDSNGVIEAVATDAYGGGALIALKAHSGIGTPFAPVRIDIGDDSNSVNVQNNGPVGDIAVSFYGGNVNIDGVSDVYNNNPTGMYFIQAENGGINLTAPFVPDVPLSVNQSVELKTLGGGDIVISGAGSGIIIPGGGTGNVKLSALSGGAISMGAGAVVAGSEPELIANHMDIQGQVLSASGMIHIKPATAGRNIELGTSGPVALALALDNTELNNMTAWDGATVPLPGTAGGGLIIGDGSSGALTFTGNVSSSAYLNVYGTSIAQSAGKIVGGVSGHASTGNVALTQPTNEISSVGGSTNGGTFTVTSTVTMYTGDITTNGGNINIQTTGPSLLLDSLMNAGTGTVQLTSAGNIVDSHVGLDIQASSATLSAPGGIGTSLDPIETQLSTLSVSATGGTGEIGIINTGNLLLSSLSFSGVTAAVETSGVLTQGSSINVTGNLGLLGQGGLNLVSGINTSLTSNVSLEAGTGADVVFSGTSGVNTSGGAISVTAGRDIIYGGSSQVNTSSGNILFDAGNDVVFNTERINTSSGIMQISAGRDYVHNSTSSHNSSSGSITIQTGRNFQYGSTSQINTTGGNITVQSVGDTTFTAGGINSSSGAILVQAGGAVSLSGGTQIVSSGNSVGIEALGAAGVGVTLTGASTKVEGADVSIVGTAAAAASSDNVGVRINGATVRSTSSDISIIGNGGNGTSNNNGIRIDGGALISSAADIFLDGTGASGTSDNTGVKIGSATVQSVGGGFINIIGQGGSGSADNNDGVRLESGAMITTAGNILIEGFGGSGGNDTAGVKLVSGSTVQSTGGGIVQLYGEGGPGVDNNHGVRLEGSALVTSAGNIEVIGFADGSGNDNTGTKLAGGTIQGTGASNVMVYGEGSTTGVNNNEGVRIESGGSVLAASGTMQITGFGGGTGTGNHGVRIAGSVANAGGGTFAVSGVGVPGTSAVVLESGANLTSASSMTFSSGFDWKGGTIGGSGSLITPSGAVTNVTSAVGLASGKSWDNAGTLNISGSGSIDLDATNLAPGIFSNQAGGVVNIASSAGWSFFSNPGQSGQIINAGTINVNQGTSWEAAFNQSAGGALNIAAGQFLSMQNGQNITGSASIGAGGTLWVSERHGVDTVFSNMAIGGSGTLQVVGGISPIARFSNVSAPGVTLRLGSGGQIHVENGATIVGGLTLDSPGLGSAFSMTDATFAQATGNLTVPSNATYAGSNTYVAQAGDLLVPGPVSGGAGSITLAAAAGNLKVNGGSVSADVVSLLGGSVTVGDSAASVPSSVTAGSALTVASLGDFKIIGGSASGASALVSSSGALTVSATGDVALAGGSGANAWAKLSGNPDVMLAGIGGAVRLDAGSGTGSYAKIDAIAPTTIYLDLINASSGGYFVNGIEGVLYDPITGTGFFAGGLPAVLGTNLVVTYGGVPLPPGSSLLEVIEEALQAPTQTLIVATNESTTPPEAEKEKNVFNEDKKEKKKEAPVCK